MTYLGRPFSVYLLVDQLKYTSMKFKEWIIDLFKDERGAVSVKPVIAFIGTLFLCVSMLINSFYKAGFSPASELINAIVVITISGMGADTLDKFSKKIKTEEPKAE